MPYALLSDIHGDPRKLDAVLGNADAWLLDERHLAQIDGSAGLPVHRWNDRHAIVDGESVEFRRCAS